MVVGCVAVAAVQQDVLVFTLPVPVERHRLFDEFADQFARVREVHDGIGMYLVDYLVEQLVRKGDEGRSLVLDPAAVLGSPRHVGCRHEATGQLLRFCLWE